MGWTPPRLAVAHWGSAGAGLGFRRWAGEAGSGNHTHTHGDVLAAAGQWVTDTHTLTPEARDKCPQGHHHSAASWVEPSWFRLCWAQGTR